MPTSSPVDPQQAEPIEPTPGRPIDPSGDAPDAEDLPRRVKALYVQGAIANAAGFSFDVVYAWVLAPETPLRWVFALRAITVLLYLSLSRLSLPDDRAALRSMFLTGVVVGVVFALLTHLTGGAQSIYVLMLALMGTAAPAVARPRGESLRLQLATWVSYAIAFAATLPLFPTSRASFDGPGAVARFAFLFGFTLATPLLSAQISHLLWSLRREIFESKRVGRYVLRKRIGRGGMGEVWSAWHVGMRREVAVKFLHAPMQDTASRKRFEREARATAALEHPHTVRIFDAGVTDDGQPYYAMELLRGRSLRQLVDEVGPLPPQRALTLIEDAARALGEAHGAGIVHRDVKPENLFVCEVGTGDAKEESVKVLDFGIAQVESERGDGKLTRTGWMAGTPAYIAPEVVEGRAATPATDVYALGAVLYFALTGTPPFPHELAAAVLFAHVHEPIETLGARAGRTFDPALEAAVARALAKAPEDRFADGAAFAVELARVPRPQSVDAGSRVRITVERTSADAETQELGPESR